MSMYVGVKDEGHPISKLYIGIDNKARIVKKLYIGIDDKARLVYSCDTQIMPLSVGNSVKVKN